MILQEIEISQFQKQRASEARGGGSPQPQVSNQRSSGEVKAKESGVQHHTWL